MSSNYPGEDPQAGRGDGSPEQQPGGAAAGEGPGEDRDGSDAEQTRPLGYWERQAAEQAGRAGPVPPYGASGHGTPPGWAGYPPPGAPGQPYGAPGQPWGGPTQPWAGYGPAVPDHPQSTLALVLGLVGLIGGFAVCGLGFLVSPFAWAIGRNAVREIEASQGRLGGAGTAQAGKVLGIVGTVLLVLALLAVAVFAFVLAMPVVYGGL